MDLFYFCNFKDNILQGIRICLVSKKLYFLLFLLLLLQYTSFIQLNSSFSYPFSCLNKGITLLLRKFVFYFHVLNKKYWTYSPEFHYHILRHWIFSKTRIWTKKIIGTNYSTKFILGKWYFRSNIGILLTYLALFVIIIQG